MPTLALRLVISEDYVCPDPDDGGSLGRPTTLFAYDAAGNLTSLTDPEDNETTWTFDGLGRVTAETNELSDARSYEYNALGKVTKLTDRNGRVIEFTYDNLSRLTEELWKSGETTVNTLSFTYNAASWLTAADDDNSDYSYTLDNLGRVTQIDIDNGTNNDVRLQATFDAAGNWTELTAEIDSGSGYVKDLKNTYTFDDLQRLTQVTQTSQSGGNAVADKRVDFTYNAAGRFTQITRYDDLSGMGAARHGAGTVCRQRQDLSFGRAAAGHDPAEHQAAAPSAARSAGRRTGRTVLPDRTVAVRGRGPRGGGRDARPAEPGLPQLAVSGLSPRAAQRHRPDTARAVRSRYTAQARCRLAGGARVLPSP